MIASQLDATIFSVFCILQIWIIRLIHILMSNLLLISNNYCILYSFEIGVPDKFLIVPEDSMNEESD